MISMVVAMAEDRGIGNGRMMWKLPDDLLWFRAVTHGKTLVAGRKTWEGLPKRYKKSHDIKVLSRTLSNGMSLQGILNWHKENAWQELCVIGGGEVYKQLFPYTTTLYLTEIKARFLGADVFFPKHDLSDWIVVENRQHGIDECHKHEFCTKVLVRPHKKKSHV